MDLHSHQIKKTTKYSFKHRRYEDTSVIYYTIVAAWNTKP